MSPEEIETIIQLAIKDELKHFWIYILISLIISIVSVLVVNYLKTKSVNFATKQDIEELTRKVEIVKGGQQLRYKKINQFYDKTIKFKSFLIIMTNEQNQNKFSELFGLTKDLLTSIESDVIFSYNLEEERKIIEENYNSWIKTIKEIQENVSTSYSINFVEIGKAIDVIQNKVLNE
jgi:hypothetical protein